MPATRPRAVFVTRESDYELLLARHATRAQARFFLESRGQSLDALEQQDARLRATLKAARAQVPDEWRQAIVRRADLDRFLFAGDDAVVVVGQDGLVANVAKYLSGQPVLGINPAPDLYDGVLLRVPLERLSRLLPASVQGDAPVERRTMVEAHMESGERLTALNEIFVGHRSHQSARYRITIADKAENQSSSGLIVASGTGATGWARSIMEATHTRLSLGIEEQAIAYFVREPFPSVATNTAIRAGKLAGASVKVMSRMNDGGIVFADGIEPDFLDFGWGRTIEIRAAAQALNLVTG